MFAIASMEPLVAEGKQQQADGHTGPVLTLASMEPLVAEGKQS